MLTPTPASHVCTHARPPLPGLAFLTMVKAGFVVSSSLGTGCIIARLPPREDGSAVWSAPSALCAANVGWGFQIGGEVSDIVLVLNSADAVETFCGSAQVTILDKRYLEL